MMKSEDRNDGVAPPTASAASTATAETPASQPGKPALSPDAAATAADSVLPKAMLLSPRRGRRKSHDGRRQHQRQPRDLEFRHDGMKLVREGSIRERAQSANNFLSGAPPDEIVTDKAGVVLTVTPSFLEFTGYDETDMVGRKCNFLQGEKTDPDDVMDLRNAMTSLSQTSVVILNYRKDGAAFWNILTIIPEFVPGTKDLKLYHGEVIGIPIPPHMQVRPRLCLDDALALIAVFSSVPRALGNDPEDENYSVDQNLLDEVFGGRKSPSRPASRPGSRSSAEIRIIEDGDDNVDGGNGETSDGETSDGDNGDNGDNGEDGADGANGANGDAGSEAGAARLVEELPSPRVYKHQDYGARFGFESKREGAGEGEGEDQGQGSGASTGGRSTRGSGGSGSGGGSDGAAYYFVAETSLPTAKGRFRVRAYRDAVTGAEPLAIICGNVEGRKDVVVRVHDQCLTSEIFGSLKCDCKQQLDFALEEIRKDGGAVLYLPQEGRGIGLANKIAAYAMQEAGLDTVDANRHLGLPDDAREYGSVRDILADLRIQSIKLLTNNPRKMECLAALGVNVSERLSCVVVPNSDYSMKYVHDKAQRMGHMINMGSLGSDFARGKKSDKSDKSENRQSSDDGNGTGAGIDEAGAGAGAGAGAEAGVEAGAGAETEA